MLRRKLSTLILVATITNFASTPLNVFAETLTSNNVIQESQEIESEETSEAKISKFDIYYSDKRQAYSYRFTKRGNGILLKN